MARSSASFSDRVLKSIRVVLTQGRRGRGAGHPSSLYSPLLRARLSTARLAHPSVSDLGHVPSAAAVAGREGLGSASLTETAGSLPVPERLYGVVSDVADGVVGEIDAEVGLPCGLDVDQALNVGAGRR